MFKFSVFIITLLILSSCKDKMFIHERVISNKSLDTLNVINPDIDTSHFVLPNEDIIIYKYESLDRQQQTEPCKWLGDTLIIKTIHNDICTKAVSIESNWVSVVKPTDNGHEQTCTFIVETTDF